MATENSSKPFIFYSDRLNFKSIEGQKGKEYWVEGYISTGDMDLVNDVVTKSCMNSMLGQFEQRTIKLDFEHETFRGSDPISTEAAKTRIPLGKAMQKSIDSKGVSVKWKLNPTWKKFDEKGNVVMSFKDVWSNVEEGFYDAFSIAYVPTRTQSISREGKSVRMLDDVNLLNVALTGNPINPAATMSAVMAKSLEFMKSQETEEINMSEVEIKDFEKLDSAIADLKTKYKKRWRGRDGSWQYEYAQKPGDKKPSKEKISDDDRAGDGAGGLSESTIDDIETDVGHALDIKNPKVTSVRDGKDGKKVIKMTSPDGDLQVVLQSDGTLEGPDGIIKDNKGNAFKYESSDKKQGSGKESDKKQKLEKLMETNRAAYNAHEEAEVLSVEELSDKYYSSQLSVASEVADGDRKKKLDAASKMGEDKKKIEEMRELAEEVDTSDLQGIATATASSLIGVKLSEARSDKKKQQALNEAEETLLEYAYGDIDLDKAVGNISKLQEINQTTKESGSSKEFTKKQEEIIRSHFKEGYKPSKSEMSDMAEQLNEKRIDKEWNKESGLDDRAPPKVDKFQSGNRREKRGVNKKSADELFIKSHLSSSNADKKHVGCKNMTEEEKNSPEATNPEPQKEAGQEAQGQTEGAEQGTQEAEAGAEAQPEASAEANPEQKSMTLRELKSQVVQISEQMKALEKENKDLKAIVEKAQYKSKGAVEKQITGQNPVTTGPLDMI